MKFLRTLTPFLVLGMALCVTVGSVYVTVNAAAQQAENATTDEVVAPVPANPNPFGAAGVDELIPDAVEIPQVDAIVKEIPALPQPVTVESLPAMPALDLPETRDHIVYLNASGGFEGQLSSLSDPDGNMLPAVGVTVQIIRGGAEIASATTNNEGTFSVSGLSAGQAALVAKGDNAFLLFGIRLVAHDDSAAITVAIKTLALEMDSAVVSGADISAATQLMFGDQSIESLTFDGAPAGASSSSPGSFQPRRIDGQKSTVLSHHTIQLQADGSLAGEVYLYDNVTGHRRSVSDLTLHFIRNGSVLQRTNVANNGTFSVSGLGPGTYSVVSTGADGITAMAIHVVDSVANLHGEEKYKLASASLAGGLTVCPTANATAGGSGAGVATPLAAAPGNTGGGSGGGGSGGGGDGGLSALAAAAAAGAIGYALGRDDKPTSPAR